VIAEPKTEEEGRAFLDRVRLACQISPSARFELHGTIKAKTGGLIKPPDLKANYLQRLESDVVTFCLLNKCPIRTIRLKPRQKGSSTWSVWKMFALLSDTPANGLIMGGAHFQGQNLFRMLKTYSENDTFDPRIRWSVLDREARCSNGSLIERITAANKEAGRSGTYQAIIATEYARWAEEGVANAADVLSGAIKTVANAAMTIIDIESTANGASGDFFDRWEGGITFEELKAGKDGFVKIFAPWFVFEDSRRDPALEKDQEQCLSDDKIDELRKQHGLDDWQVAWMLWAIREECKKDFDVFCEEYPFDAETAFRTSGRRRFDANRLHLMVERARNYPPDFGTLDPLERRVVWRPVPKEEARVIRWEQPLGGMKYLLSIDSMTGETQVGGKDPDNHAVGVIRAGMFRPDRGWVPPKLVARLVGDWALWEKNRKYELRFDIDVLESEVWKLAQYYGNCLIVPEINMDRGIIELLKLRNGARIYQREEFNRREQLKTKMLGWRTDQNTREMIIENLARAIREYGRQGEGIEVLCPITLAELQTFIVKQSGRSEAMAGKKDDCVLQLAIGLMCINGATTYAEPTVEVKLPWDLRKLEEMDRQSKLGLAMKW
jgi:hypothetical protein